MIVVPPSGDGIDIIGSIRQRTENRELVETVMSDAERPAEKRKRPIRTVLFWLHLTAGVVTGIVVFIMSITGVFLAYERQMLDASANRHRATIAASAPSSTAARLSLDSLVTSVAALPNQYRVTGVTIKSDRSLPVVLGLENRQSIFVDPYTARVLGDDSGVRGFTTWAMRWHRSLALSESTRDPVGVSITGASNLAFLFLILSGLVIWWPKQMSERAFRAVTFFSKKAKGRARDWNWHHVLGIWSAIPLAAIVASATFISYQWPQRLLETVTGSPPAPARGEGAGARAAGSGPSREGRRDGAGQREGEGRRAQGERSERGAGRGGAVTPSVLAVVPGSTELESIAGQAAAAVSGWQSISIRPGREPGSALTVSATTGSNNRPSDRVTLVLEQNQAGVVVKRVTTPQTTASRLRGWMRPIHTGEALGPVGQTIAALVSLAAVVLAYTGFALAWRRFLRSVRRNMAVSARASQS